MADDPKKKQKGKHEAKEQRRKRQARQQAGPTERKPDKEPDTPKTPAPEKLAYQTPDPEFYKSLKRETDEILKLSEEENSKYRNKEIQSNWARYEMPIESYEEMSEQEQLGADYETLIQAPVSVGTHFQFKHEKSWDVTSGPSPYQKYFDIDMGHLIVALSTIPFYERNNIDKSLFTNSDFLSMDQRATKYKQKYYSDSKYNGAELEAHNKHYVKDTERCEEVNEPLLNKLKEIKQEECDALPLSDKQQNLVLEVTAGDKVVKTMEKANIDKAKEIDEIKHSDHFNIDNKLEPSTIECNDHQISKQDDLLITHSNNITDNKLIESPEIKLVDERSDSLSVLISEDSAEVTHSQKESKKPIIESPEDLEKWLDDFLDN